MIRISSLDIFYLQQMVKENLGGHHLDTSVYQIDGKVSPVCK